MITTAHPTPSSAAASLHGAASPPHELLEARQLRDSLKVLLRKEQAAMADFLIALADFDRRRGWERLGHANLFAFIGSELGLSPAPTYWRQEAARLLQRFPDLVAPLRRGELCLTTMAELAKVLTDGNKESVLPRFLGISSREAKEIVAELQPRESPATRTVVTRLPGPVMVSNAGSGAGIGSDPGAGTAGTTSSFLSSPAPAGAPPSQLWAPKVDFGGATGSVARRDEIEPLSVERSRLHVNVSRQFTRKLEAARQGLGHAIPSATIEQALEAALDLLLEKQAKGRGELKRPKQAVGAPNPMETTAADPSQSGSPSPWPSPSPSRSPISNTTSPTAVAMATADAGTEPVHRRSGPREAVPAAIKRAVWARDCGRCAWPLDSGGCCGSTHRLQLDHVVPWAQGGTPTVDGLRLLCGRHNLMAARQAFGRHCVDRYATARHES
jgi:hypothetical protein